LGTVSLGSGSRPSFADEADAEAVRSPHTTIATVRHDVRRRDPLRRWNSMMMLPWVAFEEGAGEPSP
jgi:hypothetical protein